MRNYFIERPVIAAVACAIVIHLILVVVALFIPIRSYFGDLQKELHQFRVKSVATSPHAAANSQNLENQGKKIASFIKPAEDVSIRSWVENKEKVIPDRMDVEPKRMELEDAALLKNPDFDRVVARTEERELKEIVSSNQKSTAKTFSEIEKVKSSENSKVDMQNILEAFKKPLAGLGLYNAGNVAMDPEEGMPGFTPNAHGGSGWVDAMFDEKTRDGGPGLLKYQSLDEFLDIEVTTYQDATDAKKYFMIKIFPKKGVHSFPVLSKELIFAIDCSLSISPERLDEFKRGISFCLSHLNKEDLFNLVAFKDEVSVLSATPLQATPESIKRAEKFVMELTPNGRTDVNAAIEKIINIPLNREPSNILLLSDGRPTHGVVDARELLASVTRVNQKTRPIFVFSGGGNVNRYLLDFIAYQNRAWSQFVKRTTQIHKGLEDFYNKIRDPIFLHLRYRLNGLKENEIYPQWLPDFYANAEFTIYGSYENEDQFSMQLLGDREGQTKELIFSRSLKDAKSGTADVMKGYAFNKIYHLINRVTVEGNKPELLKEIQDLSQRYGIKTPYSPELQNVD